MKRRPPERPTPQRPGQPPGRRGPSRQRPAAVARPSPRHRPDENRPADGTGEGWRSTHVVPVETLARATVEIALTIEHAVLDEGKHADRSLSRILRERRDLGPPDRMFVSQAVFALFRWRGWLDPLKLDRPEARLLYAWLLDAPIVHPVCRSWARSLGIDPTRLISLGGAPNWTARAEGWKRLHEGVGVTADPWRLFPAWFHDQVPLPPGPASPKLKTLELLNTIQSRPSIWVRAQGEEPKAVWDAVSALGLKPWVHRRIVAAARLGPEANVHHLDLFKEGRLEIQDLASQAVGLVCDPDPGERWWDACAGAGGKALHLAALMRGKGLVVATDVNESKLKETVRRSRRSPYRNLSTKFWEGTHPIGKLASFDGVLVDAPCSAIGTWRRNPDARWTLDRDAIPRLAEVQRGLLKTVASRVKPGGTLVYSVCTLTPAETSGVVGSFLADHPGFSLDPFPHPFTGEATPGTLLLFPQEADNDAMFIARMIRSG